MFITSKSVTNDRLELVKRFGFSMNMPNTKIKWHSDDTEDNFNKNQKTLASKKLLDQLGWTADNVEYRFNNYGFRTDDEFDIDNPLPGIMTVGCSYTEGIGINVEDTWGYKVAQKLGCKFYNFGQAGSGVETQYRLIKAWAPVLKPIAILSQGSWEYRYEFATRRDPFFLTPWTSFVKHNSHLDFYKTVLTDSLHNEIMISRAYDAIKQVVTQFNIPFYELDPIVDAQGIANTGMTENIDYARDLSHPGKMYNSIVANYFYQKIVNNQQKYTDNT